jgi:hypothetical protein
MEKSDGDQILKGLAEARRFFTDVCLLLRSADDFMVDGGWKHKFLRSWDSSNNINNPKMWMPTNLYRYYFAGDEMEIHKDLIAFVAVLLDRDKVWSGFKEPWISCGLFKYREGREPSKIDTSEFDWELAAGYLEYKREPDGTFQKYTYSKDEEYGDEFAYEELMALPLIEIASADDLKLKVINPLLERILKMEVGTEKAKT